MRITYYTILLTVLIKVNFNLYGQQSTFNSPIAINTNSDNPNVGTLLDISSSKKALKITNLIQDSLDTITDCDGAIVYNKDSLRFETLISYREIKAIGNLAVNPNSSDYEYGPNNFNKPYLYLPHNVQIDSISVYLTNCTANISQLTFLFRTYAQGECNLNNFINEGSSNYNSINDITFNDWNTFTFPSPIQLGAFERIYAFFLAPAQDYCNGKFSSPASINGLGNIALNNCQEQENNEPSFIWHISRIANEWKKLN